MSRKKCREELFAGCTISKERIQFCAPSSCARCGFNAAEMERRKDIPLTARPDGLRSKKIPKKGAMISA